MQNKNSQFLSMLESYIDMMLNMAAFLISYIFVLFIIPDPREILLDNPITIAVLCANMLLASFVYHALNLYSPTRYTYTFRSFPAVLRANLLYFGMLAVISAFSTREGYRDFILFWVLFAAIISTAFLTSKRHIIRLFLKSFRQKQYTLKKVIIVGDNTNTAAAYIKEINSNAQYGTMVLGYVGDKIEQSVIGIDKLGSFKELSAVLEKHKPTDVVFAIDSYDKWRLIKLVNLCEDKCIKVYFIPVIYGFFKSQNQLEQVGAIPLINIHSTPLDNLANAAIKRAIDIVGSIALIILTLPIMAFAAIGVLLSSPGPILFKQVRVGKMGKRFTMYKFRSMRLNKDANNVWSPAIDERKTRFGTFLRRTAIDELPQLFNVLAGSMSLVGPRPELPVFVEEFKEKIPLYMVKHYVKPGMTGLAQIKGLRGDTSLEDRIHEDINYIENWTLLLDIVILLKTPLKAINKAEVYIPPKKDEENKKKPAKQAPAEEKADSLGTEELIISDKDQEKKDDPTLSSPLPDAMAEVETTAIPTEKNEDKKDE